MTLMIINNNLNVAIVFIVSVMLVNDILVLCSSYDAVSKLQRCAVNEAQETIGPNLL